MTDSTRPDDAARTPEQPPEAFGNTIDGSGAGDGSTTRGGDEADFAADSDRATGSGTSHGSAEVTSPHAASGAGGDGAGGDAAARRDEQKRVYQTPEQPDHAVGGSDGTADGQ